MLVARRELGIGIGTATANLAPHRSWEKWRRMIQGFGSGFGSRSCCGYCSGFGSGYGHWERAPLRRHRRDREREIEGESQPRRPFPRRRQ